MAILLVVLLVGGEPGSQCVEVVSKNFGEFGVVIPVELAEEVAIDHRKEVVPARDPIWRGAKPTR